MDRKIQLSSLADSTADSGQVHPSLALRVLELLNRAKGGTGRSSPPRQYV